MDLRVHQIQLTGGTIITTIIFINQDGLIMEELLGIPFLLLAQIKDDIVMAVI